MCLTRALAGQLQDLKLALEGATEALQAQAHLALPRVFLLPATFHEGSVLTEGLQSGTHGQKPSTVSHHTQKAMAALNASMLFQGLCSLGLVAAVWHSSAAVLTLICLFIVIQKSMMKYITRIGQNTGTLKASKKVQRSGLSGVRKAALQGRTPVLPLGGCHPPRLPSLRFTTICPFQTHEHH